MTALSQFDGRDVLSATISVTNAGDGLSKALGIDPEEFHHGDRVYVVLETLVDKVRFDPIKDTDALQRVHVLKAGTATIVDENLVREALDEMELKLERAQGVVRLPGMGGEDPDAPDDPGDLSTAQVDGGFLSPSGPGRPGDPDPEGDDYYDPAEDG